MSAADKIIEAHGLALISVGQVMLENGVTAGPAWDEWKERHRKYLVDSNVHPELVDKVIGYTWYKLRYHVHVW